MVYKSYDIIIIIIDKHKKHVYCDKDTLYLAGCSGVFELIYVFKRRQLKIL